MAGGENEGSRRASSHDPVGNHWSCHGALDKYGTNPLGCEHSGRELREALP